MLTNQKPVFSPIDQSDINFQNFCSVSVLVQAVGTSDVPTYHGYNKSVSRIEYVMMHKESSSIFGIREEDLSIISQVCKEDNPSIISNHDVINFKLKIPANPLPGN
jgi:hypothetical protein